MADDRVNFILTAQDRASATVAKLKGELHGTAGAADKTAGRMSKLNTATGGLISPMTLGIGAAAGLAGAFFSTAQGAADLAEEVDKSRIVFGPVSDEMVEFAEGASKIGLSTKAALGAAGAFGNMFNTVGLAQAESQDMSQTMVQLAADMGSFNNVDPTEMLDKLRSGLSGEAEPLRQFGVLLSEASVKAYAMQNGIGRAGEKLTEGEKVLARYGLILQQTTIQQGNFADTSESLANSQRIWAATLEDTSDAVGALAASIVKGFMTVTEVILQGGPTTNAALSETVNAALDANSHIQESSIETANTMEAEYMRGAHGVRAAMAEAEQALKTGGPVLAVEAGKIAGMLPHELDAKLADIRQAGRESVVEFAAGILEKQNDPALAWDAAVAASETAMTRSEEIAAIHSRLSSAEFTAGINNGIPGVRAAFQAYATEAQGRLSSLGADSFVWGSNIGWSLAHGLSSQYYQVYSAAAGLGSAIRGQLQIRSEPPDASSPLRGITQWGGNVAKTIAADMLAHIRVVRSAAGAIGGALVPDFGSGGGAMVPAPAGVGAFGGGVIELHVHSYLDGKELTESVTRHQYYGSPAGPTVLPRGS